MAQQYTVQTEIFHGPLDLLLNLIEKRKLFINDISLAKVTDDFIHYVQEQGSLPMSQTSHFIYIASTLLLIKSKSLLPTLQLTEEEEGSIEDLEHRLQLYRRIKELSGSVRSWFGNAPLFRGEAPMRDDVIFSPHERISVSNIAACANDILHDLPQPEARREAVVDKVVSLEQMVDRLTQRVQRNVHLSFKDFAGQTKTREQKVEAIVSFLAMLELVKQNVISVKQSGQFDDIHMESQNISTPRYGT